MASTRKPTQNASVGLDVFSDTAASFTLNAQRKSQTNMYKLIFLYSSFGFRIPAAAIFSTFTS